MRPYRVALARALVREHIDGLAAVQYDTLMMGISVGPMPDPLVLRREQAHAYLDGGDVVIGAAQPARCAAHDAERYGGTP